jgi:hypothetical protein
MITEDLTDYGNQHMEYFDALKELWRTVEDKDAWQLGYNPAYTTACERLRKLDHDFRERGNEISES